MSCPISKLYVLLKESKHWKYWWGRIWNVSLAIPTSKRRKWVLMDVYCILFLYFALSVVILTWFTATFTLIQATAASCDEIWYCCLSLVYLVWRWWLWMDAVASVCLCGFWNDFSEGAVTTDSGSAFHVSTILLLKLVVTSNLSAFE